MRLTRIAAVALLVITVVSTVACGTKSYQPPTPEFTTPGTGAAVGQVMHTDGSLVENKAVSIFKSGETSIFASCYVDDHGYYSFDNLPPDNYDAYIVASNVLDNHLENRLPNATITVLENEITYVAPITY